MIRILDHAYGFGLAIACCVVACVAAAAAHFLVRATAVLAEKFPSTFMLLVFVTCLWVLLHYAFGRRVEH